MRGIKNITLKEAIADVEDPRMDRVNRYPLVELLFVAMITVICGAKSYAEMTMIAREKIDWFRRYLPYDNGIPGSGTLRNVIRRLKPEQMHRVFVSWMGASLEAMKEDEILPDVLALDGKVIRGSAAGGKNGVNIVSAFATAASLVIAQVACDRKSNEIKAIPKILDMIYLKGITVTIDAIGAQRDIADQINKAEGYYLLQVKGNQEFLHEALQDAFAGCGEDEEVPEGMSYFKTEEMGHGRIEKRECFVLNGRKWMGGTAEYWPSVRYGAMIRNTIMRNGKTTVSTHYFIGNQKKLTAQDVLRKKRKHWGIENQLHWILDMQFEEDSCTAHADNSAENLNSLRHIAYNVLRSLPGMKGSFSNRQLLCLLNSEKLDQAAAALGCYPR